MNGHYCIHVIGPDDVIAMPDRPTAIRQSLDMNDAYGEYLLRPDVAHDPNVPIAWAVPTTYEALGIDPPRVPEDDPR